MTVPSSTVADSHWLRQCVTTDRQVIAAQSPRRKAKSVFQAHDATATGEPVFRKTLSHGQFLKFLSEQRPCVVAMEACASSHFGGREIMKLGHEVRLIPPIYVKPFVKR